MLNIKPTETNSNFYNGSVSDAQSLGKIATQSAAQNKSLEPSENVRVSVAYKRASSASHHTFYESKIAMTLPTIYHEEITIRPFPQPEMNDIHMDPDALENLGLTHETLKELLAHILALSSDSKLLFSFLKPLDEALSRKLKERNIVFSEQDHPPYFIAGRGYFMPGPSVQPLKKKYRILDETILEHEHLLGINPDGAPVFLGFIHPSIANLIVKSGRVFKENLEIASLASHGKNTHRLFLLALMNSLKGTKFEYLKAVDILHILIDCKIQGRSAWGYMLDSIRGHEDNDTKGPARESTHPNLFRFNCASPFIMNSLLLCFGDRLGLPNLMYCMRDSHWKAINKMADRVTSRYIGKSLDEEIRREIVPATLLLMQSYPGDIGTQFRFNLSVEQAAMDPKYEIYDQKLNNCYIKRKRARPKQLKEQLSEFARQAVNIQMGGESPNQPVSQQTTDDRIREFAQRSVHLQMMGKSPDQLASQKQSPTAKETPDGYDNALKNVANQSDALL